MNNLIRTEWFKIKKYRAFWWVMAITALSYPGINYIFQNIFREFSNQKGETAMLMKMLVGNPFTFPEVWHTLAYASSFFVFIPAIVVIMFITNEFTYKTHRQNVIDGWSRDQFMTSKMLDVLIISLLITVLYTAVTVIIGFANSDASSGNLWEQSWYIGLFALQTFSQLSIAFLFGFLIKKAFMALGAFLFYFLIFEPIIERLLRLKTDDAGRFLPVEISDRMIPIPAFVGRLNQSSYLASLDAISTHVIYTVILTALIWFICFRINNRRDL